MAIRDLFLLTGGCSEQRLALLQLVLEILELLL